MQRIRKKQPSLVVSFCVCFARFLRCDLLFILVVLIQGDASIGTVADAFTWNSKSSRVHTLQEVKPFRRSRFVGLWNSDLSCSAPWSASSPASASEVVGDDDNKNNNNKNNKQRSSSLSSIHGVAPRSGPLNLAVAQIANITLEQANALIDIGAVWARLETLTPEELLGLYYEDDDGSGDYDSTRIRMSSSSRALYADIDTSGQGRRQRATEGEEDTDDEDDIDAYIERMEQIRYRRILTPTTIDAGTDLRIYPNPRRFTQACQAMSSDSLLYEDTTFLVVDKPPMLPTQPDATNYQECCPGCANQALGPFVDIQGRVLSSASSPIKRPLICHRVDSVVGGCVVMSKDRNGQRVFAQLQRERKIRKVYLAVTTSPVPLGRHIHWMWSPQTTKTIHRGKAAATTTPRLDKTKNAWGGGGYGPPCQLIRHEPPESRRKAREFWNRCVLEVVQCAPISIPPEAFLRSAANNNNDDATTTTNNVGGLYTSSTTEEINDKYKQPPQQQYFQSVIRLVTGRKHQVRAQLASLGCPVIRDTLYQPMAGLTLDALEKSSGLVSDNDDDDEEQVEDKLHLAVAQCRVPTEPIGLQAHAISFGGVKAVANAPWWTAARRTTT